MDKMAAQVVLKNAKVGQQTHQITYADALQYGWWLSCVFGSSGWLIRKPITRCALFKSSCVKLQFPAGFNVDAFEKAVDEYNLKQFAKYYNQLVECKDGRTKESKRVCMVDD